MTTGDLERTIRDLLDYLGTSFLLQRRIGELTLGEQLDAIIRQAATTELVEFGTPGDSAELRRRSEGAMRFFYRPHLFPGMDPALHLGHLVQYDLLPRELPGDSPIEAVAMLESYCHLSGDLFGWQPTGDGGITLWQLDVSGHGVRAGFAAVVFKLILSDTDLELPLPELVDQLETRFIETRNPEDPGCIYATGVFLRIDDRGGCEYLSAGHPPLLIRRADGTVEALGSTSVPIALIPGSATASVGFELGEDDAVLVSTDGLIELHNSEDEIFGVDGAIDELAASDGTPMGIYRGLIDAVNRFHELDRLDDDLSFVALRRRR